MAPRLLNVPVKIRSFYGLQSVGDELEAGLARSDPANPIADLPDELMVYMTSGVSTWVSASLDAMELFVRAGPARAIPVRQPAAAAGQPRTSRLS